MITISKKTEYALLLLSFLDKQEGSTPLSTAARKLGLPYRFLGQVAMLLKQADILDSKEGKNGGYEVTGKWKKINMLELLKILGEDKHMVECLGDSKVKCALYHKCNAHRIWGKLESVMTEELKKIIISQL